VTPIHSIGIVEWLRWEHNREWDERPKKDVVRERINIVDTNSCFHSS